MVKIQNTLQINKKKTSKRNMNKKLEHKKKKFKLLINLWKESLISSQRKMY